MTASPGTKVGLVWSWAFVFDLVYLVVYNKAPKEEEIFRLNEKGDKIVLIDLNLRDDKVERCRKEEARRSVYCKYVE